MFLKKKIFRGLSYLFPKSVKEIIRNKFFYSRVAYSNEGEDLILQKFFHDKKDGFFIDVGAHHPTRYSNTYLFYLKGWRGINIDAMPGSMEPFRRLRPADINIECPISDKQEELVYYIFNEPALNTFSEEEAYKKDGFEGYQITKKQKLITRTLSDVLSLHLKDKTEVDFLSVDVEGLDLQVLKSMDFDIVKPKVILVEDLDCDLETVFEHDGVGKYLRSKGYKLFAKTGSTLFFKLEN